MLEKLFNAAKNTVMDTVSRFTNREFLEAVIAASTLVIAADGIVAAEEKLKLRGAVRVNPHLKAYSDETILTVLDECLLAIETEFAYGKTVLLERVKKIRKDDAQAKMAMQICCMIAAADGNVDDKEKEVLREICATLNLNKADFSVMG